MPSYIIYLYHRENSLQPKKVVVEAHNWRQAKNVVLMKLKDPEAWDIEINKDQSKLTGFHIDPNLKINKGS